MYLSQYKEKDLKTFSEKKLKEIIVEDSIFNQKLESLINKAEKQGRTTIDIEKVHNI
tara:strand:- start:62 stop:232 length:171 start_codon:yes stop_codon:yes gene_type:complete